MKTFEYTVKDELGLHARPAGQLVKEATKYTSAVSVSKGDKEADAKKVFRLMSMGVKQGDTLRFVIEGEDEETAAKELEAFVQSIL